MAEAKITQINPITFELEDYSTSDENLISSVEVSTLFNPNTDYIEYFIYNPNNGGLISPPPQIPANYEDYTLEDNILVINPEDDLYANNIFEGNYNTFYNFLSTRLDSNFDQRYFISEISSDRTEIRLDSNDISAENIISSSLNFIQERNTDEYYPDFYLNFGGNQLVIANNIKLDGETVLIKLYESLPPQFQLKSTLWVVESVADPIAYSIELPIREIIVDNSIKLKGPNINIPVKGQINNSTEQISYSDLVDTSLTSSLQQINSFYEDPSIQINVDYTDFSNFIKFSSAEKRLNNFFYKLGQIQNWTSFAQSGSNAPVSSVSSSTAYYQNKINETINQFDNYEYYLYYSSGSKAWPKSNSSQPYVQVSTTSILGQTWITSSLSTASLYDSNNQDWVYYAIPEYLREDLSNQPYFDFTNMVGHFYDENIWVYIKDITNKWNNDNRIDFGISRDLIAQQLRDLGFNLYENQFSSFNLFVSTLGLTPSGSYFPFPYMTGSLPTPSGFEYVNNSITGSNEVLPQDDVNKRLYKRIYNNLSYLYKKKGTVDGIRTLATIYGIPNTLLRIDEFGGKDKTNVNDWDYWFEQFNYKYESTGDAYVATTWSLDPGWSSLEDRPETVEFRFKSLPADASLPRSQSLWSLDDGRRVKAVLEYDTNLLVSASFSGSIPNPNYKSGSLRFTTDDFATSTVLSLPFLDGDWWNVSITRDEPLNYTLRAANSLYSGSNGSSLGWEASSSFVAGDEDGWITGEKSYFPSLDRNNIDNYVAFTGSYQEIRYYNTVLNSQSFFDHTMNPQSFEGNSINSAPDELAFRATLGGELYTGSLSMHPKVSGSWVSQSSFTSNNSSFNLEGTSVFKTNREYVFMDQPAVGIKNRITDKIRQVALNLPEGNQQLSNIRSIQQDTETDDAYTNTVNQVEVVLSPTNQINDDIISSIGYFNVGDYIGDPRQIISGSTTYPDLDNLRDDYFLKYTSNYDWNDFIRLIKFFDNSLWKTIKDFIPAKISSATGISIKQHLLERQKYPQPSASYSEPKYTGSIGQIAGLKDGERIYTSSGDYDSIPIEAITGSQGGTLPIFIEDTNYTKFTYPGAVNVTQSWEGAYMTPFSNQSFTQDDAREFINGEFSGSALLVTDGELNTGCDPYKKPNTTEIQYNIVSLANNDGGVNSGTYPQRIFTFFVNPPSPIYGTDGDIVLWWDATYTGFDGDTLRFNWEYSIKYVKIFKESANGIDNSDYLSELKEIILDTNTFTVNTSGTDLASTTTSKLKCDVIGITEYSSFYLYQISPEGLIRFSSTGGTPDGIGIVEQTNILSVLSPYVPYGFSSGDCNAIYGNELEARQSKIFWDLDYSSNAIQAVNQQTVMTASQQGGNLPKAYVQDYNWYSTPILRRNYIGAKSTSPGFNQNSTSGGFGVLPVVESLGAILAQFGSGRSASPEILTAGNVTVNTLLLVGSNKTEVNTLSSDQTTFTGVIEQSFRSNDNIEAYQYGNDQANIGGLNVVESSIQVPNISSFMIPNISSSGNVYGQTFEENGQDAFILSANVPTVEINPTTNTYQTGSPATVDFVRDTLIKGIEQGEKWYISLYTTMSNPIEYVGEYPLTPFVMNSSSYANGDLVDPLGYYGVRQIVSSSVYIDPPLPDEFYFYLNQKTNSPDWTGGGTFLGDRPGYPNLGALIWRSNGNGIVVRENTLNNVGSGVVYKEYSNQPIIDNIEDIVTNFGSKTR